jgi:uncharacterized membrane protein
MPRVRITPGNFVALLAALGSASFASLAIISLRVQQTQSGEYVFLRWNLALAWLPVVFAIAMLGSHRARLGRPLTVACGILWLVFFPNAPYLVTDVIHLGNSWASAPIWFDAIMFVVFGFTGLLLGYASLYIVHAVIADSIGPRASWLLVIVAFPLSSMGIYLGRVLRLNSWDVFLRPHALLEVAQSRLDAPLRNPESIALVLAMALALAGGYSLFVAFAHPIRRTAQRTLRLA